MAHPLLSDLPHRGIRLLGIGLALSLLGLWILIQASILAHHSQAPPTAIVVLGGGIRREAAAAQLAQIYPDLPIIISSGSPIPCLYRVFVQEHHIDWPRVKVDLRAGDTLTNFTAVLPYLQQQGHRHVMLVTSAGHLQRSLLLATLIWGSYGIASQPQVIPGYGHHESWGKLIADGVRAVAWVVLGEWVASPFYHDPDQIQSSINRHQSRCEIGSASLPRSVDPLHSLLPEKP